MTDAPRNEVEPGMDRRSFIRYGAGSLGAVGLGGFVAACGGSSKRGTTTNATDGPVKRGGQVKIAFGDGQSNDSLDPALQFTGVGQVAGGMVFDTLLHVDDQWNLTPMLAEDWDHNADATRYTFKLRKGVEFHSGKALEAADVEAHIKRLLDKKTGSGGLSLLTSVLDPSGVKVSDPSTIVFDLKAPDAFFGVRMSHYYLRIPERGTTNWLKTSPGTGPFKNSSFKPGVGFTLIRNPNYWQSGQPYLDQVNLVNIAEQSTRVQGILSGDIDITDPPPFTALAQLQGNTNIAIIKQAGGSPYLYDIDGSIKPFSDARVKQALKMAIDRQKAVEIITLAHGTPTADSIIPPSDPFYPADLKAPGHDPEQAKALLAQAGYGSGFKELVWTTKAYPYLDEGAAFIKDQFASLGINLTIRSVSNDQYLKAFLNEPIVMDYALRQHPALAFDLFYASSGGANTARLKDKQMDQRIKEFKATPDAGKQKELSGEIIRRYATEAAELVPFHFDRPYPFKKRVKGLAGHPMGLLELRKAWVA